MIINLTYNKSTGVITVSDDEGDMELVINDSQTVDNDSGLFIELSLNVSAYQLQFEEDLNGNDN